MYGDYLSQMAQNQLDPATSRQPQRLPSNAAAVEKSPKKHCEIAA
jgi:hypothetical protein